MSKIPCFILIFEQVDIIKKCLNFLTKYSSRINIIVLENFSENTNDIIKPYVLDLLDKDLVWKYYLFDKNIKNNAWHIAINEAIKTYLDPKVFPYVYISDGDFTVESPDWIDEQLNVLEKCPEVFACGLSLDKSNLPLKSMPEAIHWVYKTNTDAGLYYTGRTGNCFMLTKTQYLIDAMNYINSKGLRYLDTHMWKVCELKKMKWARTKKALCYHMTWDLYNDLNHPYTVMKVTNGNKLWLQHESADYQLFEKSNSQSLSHNIHSIKQYHEAVKILEELHKKLVFEGDFNAEYEEQIMSIMFIEPTAKVLELGSNIGRNTCIIASILNNSKNLVTLETMTDSCDCLRKNKESNNFEFEIVNAGLSYRPLIQTGWLSVPSEYVPARFVKPNVMTFQELEEKYQIQFDTLVLDCEGAFYYVLMDYPQLLTNVNKVLLENDFVVVDHKKYIDNVFKKYGFTCVYQKELDCPSLNEFDHVKDNFYEVWKKIDDKI